MTPPPPPPLGPLLFALLLQKVVISISKDSICADLLLHRWYLNDGAVAGSVLDMPSVGEIVWRRRRQVRR